ncbi:unnamed protein product [Phytophthora fragariaefolia]|uniref:Unnamed protein product n=1 Tax=Phytophthora fragariaefolia TaxID=1490495 RepID=A0A9W7CZI8_9STRA|nr:unnamed protein product [Phytophthora fragariaefolia]
MKILGYSTDELLIRARDVQTEWDLAGADDTTAPTEETTPLLRVCRLQAAAMETSAPIAAVSEDVERYETRTAFPTMAPEVLTVLIRTLELRFKVAREMGLVLEPRARLKANLSTRQDVFRLQFGDDPPVRVAPLQVRLKPGATPTRSQPRRYSPDDRAFLERHVDALLQHILVFRNPRIRWASAPRIVKKKELDHDPLADPRMTVDTRAENESTEAMPWPMPVLEVVIGELEGAHVFFVLDWFRGYWQLPLHPDAQEHFTFVTHRGMYTPTRVPMGATDAVAYYQGVGEEIFGDLLGNGILCWLDDFLAYAADATALMELLDKVLARCEEYGLKLHAKKCQFFATEVKRCGKLISAQGVMHCPERVQCLINIPLSMTAGEMQQFLCAINWMRQGIPEYLLLRPRGFHLYIDHRNLVYMFGSYGSDGTMARYRADKLQRWALSLMYLKYVIEHVPGEVNAWGDLLRRWGAGPAFPAESTARRVARLAVVDLVPPLQEAEFVWPSEGDIHTLHQDPRHQEQARAAGVNWDEDRALLLSSTGKVWIPPDATELQ